MKKWRHAATYEYAATYKGGKFGNTTVNVVAPPPKSEEEIKRILEEYHQAGWDIWDSLSIEEQIQINKEATAESGKG